MKKEIRPKQRNKNGSGDKFSVIRKSDCSLIVRTVAMKKKTVAINLDLFCFFQILL